MPERRRGMHAPQAPSAIRAGRADEMADHVDQGVLKNIWVAAALSSRS